MSASLKKLLLINGIIALLMVTALVATYWFRISHVGWLIEDVTDVLSFNQEWQVMIDTLDEVNHPAVIHYQPDGCLCRVFNAAHSANISSMAAANGFAVYQLNSQYEELGKSIEGPLQNTMGPLIAITRPDGQLAYVGAYSDGVRCNTGTSMVDSFLSSPDALPKMSVVGLDVQTCRCLN
jgi:hypothetical protein